MRQRFMQPCGPLGPVHRQGLPAPQACCLPRITRRAGAHAAPPPPPAPPAGL